MMLMLQLVLLLIGVVELMMASGEIRSLNLVGKREGENVEDDELRCQAILTSSNVQFFEQNIFMTPSESVENGQTEENIRNIKDEERERAVNILVDNRKNIVDRSSRLERIARTLRSSIYAPKLCNPQAFYPYIADSSDSTMSCYQICSTCVPGSASVCHQRNHRFPGVGQTCFCTYDFQNPLHNAVLVIKNAPRSRGY